MPKDKFTIVSAISLSSLFEQVGNLESEGWSRIGEVVHNSNFSEYSQAMCRILHAYAPVCADTKEELIHLVHNLIERGWNAEGSLVISEKKYCITMKRQILNIFSDDVEIRSY